MTATLGAPTVYVTGVSGAGKTTVAGALAERLGRPFIDADDLHPQRNVAKMAAGVPLTDADREPWLVLVGEAARATREAGAPAVVACSALRRAYRDVLREADPDARFVQLHIDGAVLAERLATRTHPFMPATLLPSQLAALEPLTAEEGMAVDAAAPLEAVVAQIGRDGSIG